MCASYTVAATVKQHQALSVEGDMGCKSDAYTV